MIRNKLLKIKMSINGYAILDQISQIESTNKEKGGYPWVYDENGNPQKKVIQILDVQSIEEVNRVLTNQLKSPIYQSDLDRLMVFSTTFSNFTLGITIWCIYVQTLGTIDHPLFLNKSDIHNLLKFDHNDLTWQRVCNSYSYGIHRFNNKHQGDFVRLNERNEVIILSPEENENSHGIVRSS